MKKLPSFENQSGQIREVFLFSTKRNFINICKRYLSLLETLRVDHDVFIKKLEEEVDPKIVKKLDYLDETKYNYIRKQVLDAGNDSYRDLENFADMLEIELKKDKGNNG